MYRTSGNGFGNTQFIWGIFPWPCQGYLMTFPAEHTSLGLEQSVLHFKKLCVLCSQVYKYLWKLVSTDTSTDQFVSFSKVKGNINLSKCNNNRLISGEKNHNITEPGTPIFHIGALDDILLYM